MLEQERVLFYYGRTVLTKCSSLTVVCKKCFSEQNVESAWAQMGTSILSRTALLLTCGNNLVP